METRTQPLIDVFVADKSPLVRMAMKTLLGGDARFNLIGTAEDGDLFLRALDTLTFRVGVIGWAMPYLDGAGVLERLRERPDPKPAMLVYTGDPSPDIPRRAMELGAAGFCHKAERPDRLLSAIETVARGHMTFPYTDFTRMEARPASPLDTLTGRERELLACLAEGQSNARIAARFGISLHTVKFHLKNVFGKLGVSNRAGAAAAYIAASGRGGSEASLRSSRPPSSSSSSSPVV
jgi:two-component system nitrate/nitrite response regulator NarP